MSSRIDELTKGTEIFAGVDLHKSRWHVTIRTKEVELCSVSIPGCWESLRKILDRYEDHKIFVVYEAGYFGFWLYDELRTYGADCTVTPPSLVPGEYGNRVKTDRRDSRKLAHLLAKGMLKRIWVPSEQERGHITCSQGQCEGSRHGTASVADGHENRGTVKDQGERR